ncbi:MAG TPA: UUP1 family membrane protein [Gammaproteobacteria bacterium]|nr:UUP1 family membrane protein [Gammaproteobacteria bacterium]
MSNKHLYVLTGVLILIGLVIFLYKVLFLNFPLTGDTTVEVWRAEATITFEARGRPVKLNFFIPGSSAELPTFEQSFVTRNYGFITQVVGGNRQAVFTINKASGKQALFFRTKARRLKPEFAPVKAPEPRRRSSGYRGAELQAANSIVDTVTAQAADTESLVGLIVSRLRTGQRGREATLLMGGAPTSKRVATTAVRLLRHAGVPARVINGVSLKEARRNAPLVHWIEVYIRDSWVPFDVDEGTRGIATDRLPWWRGPQRSVSGSGAVNIQVNFAVTRDFDLALRSAVQQARRSSRTFMDFSILSLPLQTQHVYRILLMVPLGIFFLVVLRNVVGMKAFGTFMPVLIAMAFRETQLMWGVILFTLIVGFGLMIRFYLEHLKLLLVPRLAVLVMVVVITMMILSVLTHNLGLDRGLSISLFPIVIMTMTIERMTIVWDERGAGEAVKQALGSLVIAAIAYAIMSNTQLEHLFFVFPELLLVVVAVTLLLGRYKGFRLMELTRFKVLATRSR